MKFHILQVKDGEASFDAVDGELVDIGEGAQAFITNGNPEQNVFPTWRVSDAITGMRLSDVYALQKEAVKDAREKFEACGLKVYKKKQEYTIALFGKAPGAAKLEEGEK